MPRDHERSFGPNRDDDGGSLSDVIIVVRRWIRPIAWVSGTLIAAFVGLALGWPAVWESRAVIRLDQELVHDTYAEYYVQTLQQQVFTDENLSTWAEEFGLHRDEPSMSRRIERLAGDLGTEIVTQIVTDPVSGRERDLVTGFAVYYRGASAEIAQEVANAAAAAFLEIDQTSQENRGRQRIEFFSREAHRYRQRIADVEAKLADFKETNGRALPELTNLNLTAMERIERDIETLLLQLGNLRRERVILQSQLNQVPVSSDQSLAQLSVLQNEYVRLSSIYQQHHPAVVSVLRQIEVLSEQVGSAAAVPLLVEQRETTATRLEEARKRYSEDHPEVRRLTRAVAALDERIAAMPAADSSYPDVSTANSLYVQLDTQIKAIDTEIDGLSTRLDDLNRKRDEYERLIILSPRVEQEYLELQRDLENAKQMYEETQAKQREAELALALESGTQGQRLRLAGAASLPVAPAWPPRAALIILGVLLGASAALGLAAVQELLSSTVRGSKDARRLTGAPPIAMIPRLSNRADRLRKRLHAAGFAVAIVALVAMSYQGAQGLG